MERTKKPDYYLNFAPDNVNLRAFTKDEDGKEVKYLRGTASSTAQDFYGSIINGSGQVKMLNKLQALASKAGGQSGLTAFVNHSYAIPEDVLGMFTSAALTTRISDGVDGIAGGDKGVEYIDLDIECRVIDSNPRAVAAWEQVKEGVRHGWSIGAYFLEAEYASDDQNDPGYWDLIVSDLELLEISLVGIPANQRAWTRSVDGEDPIALKIAERIARQEGLRDRVGRLAPARLNGIRDMARRSIVEHDDDNAIEGRAMAIEFRRLADEPSDEMTAENRAALERAADLLEGRAAAQANDPDDGSNMLADSIGHIARAVGHGLCVRSAAHLAKALDCLSVAVAANGGEAEPGGDFDPAVDSNLNSAGSAIADLRTMLQTMLASKVVGAQTALDVLERATRVADTNSTAALVRETNLLKLIEAGVVEDSASGYVLGTWAADRVTLAADPKKPYGNVEYADPGYQPDGVKRYPLDTEEHIKAAASYFGKQSNRDKYTQTQQKHIEAKIAAAEKRHGIGDASKDAVEPDDITVESVKLEVTKLSPADGDVVVIRSDMDGPTLAKFAEEWRASSGSQAMFLSLDRDGAATIEQAASAALEDLVALEAKVNDAKTAFDTAIAAFDAAQNNLAATYSRIATAETTLTETSAAIDAKKAEIATAETQLATATKQYDDLQLKIKEAKETRLGRRSANFEALERLAATQSDGAAYVKPEHYQMSAAEQQAALKRQATGNQQPPTGRDLATAQP